MTSSLIAMQTKACNALRPAQGRRALHKVRTLKHKVRTLKQENRRASTSGG